MNQPVRPGVASEHLHTGAPTVRVCAEQSRVCTPTLTVSGDIIAGEHPTEYPGEHPTEYPGEHPTEYPGEYPTEYPGEHPTEYPGEHPCEYPGEYPGEHPR